MQKTCTLADMEAAINYWRARLPSQSEAMCLCAQASALAEPYALMIFNAQRTIALADLPPAAQQALNEWYEAHQGA